VIGLAGRELEWLDLEHLLAADPQRRATGDEDAEPRGDREELGGQDRGRQQMLEVVDDQHQFAVPEVVRQRVRARSVAAIAQGEGAGDLRRHQRRIGHLLEADERRAVRVVRLLLAGQLDQQPSLPDSTWTGQRQQTHVGIGQQPAEGSQLTCSSDQTRQRPRKA
jgi:hypothetical protein